MKLTSKIVQENYDDGYWTKTTYDSNGNLTYWGNSDGEWVKHTYDSNGNETYYEDSDGYWGKYTYDENGIVLKTEHGRKENKSNGR